MAYQLNIKPVLVEISGYIKGLSIISFGDIFFQKLPCLLSKSVHKPEIFSIKTGQ